MKTVNSLRDLGHILACMTLLYIVGNYTEVYQLGLFNTILLSLGAGFTVGCGMGAVYEFMKWEIFQNPTNDWDIYRSGSGGFIGMFLACFFKDVYIFPELLLPFCGVLLLLDLGFATYRKIKK